MPTLSTLQCVYLHARLCSSHRARSLCDTQVDPTRASVYWPSRRARIDDRYAAVMGTTCRRALNRTDVHARLYWSYAAGSRCFQRVMPDTSFDAFMFRAPLPPDVFTPLIYQLTHFYGYFLGGNRPRETAWLRREGRLPPKVPT